MKTALDAFLPDPLPPDAAACYQVEERAWFLDEHGDIKEVPSPKKQAHFPLVELDPTLLLLRAIEMHLMVARVHETISEVEVSLWFHRWDIPFDSLWTLGDTTIARTDGEFLGRRPTKDGKCNLILFNPNGVVSVKPTPRHNLFVS